MSGIKGVIKYISQLLILSSFSIIFLPIICLKCYEEKSEISIHAVEHRKVYKIIPGC